MRSREAIRDVLSLIAPVVIVTVAGQSAEQPAGRPAFEVVSVKRNVDANARTSISSPPGRYTATNVPLMVLVNSAYRLAPYQYVGMPGWADSERFDVAAKAPDGARTDQTPVMLQSLLADRFKLVAHMETRDSPVYTLVMARADRRLGPQLTKSTTDCTAILAERQAAARSRGARPVPVPSLVPGQRPVCNMRATSRQTASGALLSGYSAGNTTMTRLAEILRAQLRRHVVDRTRLEGEFDFDLEYAHERPPSAAPAGGAAPTAPIDEGPSIFTALEEQLGLKLEATRGPVEYLVIDRVERPVDD
jgi:uncharacterized protein (TIGR03435 family)